MNFELSEEQLLIRESVVKLCADFPDDYWSKKDTEHEFPWDFYEAMAEAGWLGIAIPEAYGGSGRGITEASLVLEDHVNNLKKIKSSKGGVTKYYLYES